MGDQLKIAQSILDWWTLAGVDQSYGETPVDWLSAAPPAPIPAPQPPPTDAAARPAIAPATHMPRPSSGRTPIEIPLPDTLEGLRQWLATSSDVPAAGPPASRIAPIGNAGAALLVVTAMPDPIDVAMGSLLAGEPGALFDRMLSAIGFNRADIGIISLAISPIAGGRIAPDTVARLVEIARHHIALAQPRFVLVLGDKASRALLATDVASARTRLLEIKLKSAVIPAVATFHPRTLARNEQFKRSAWDSLKLLQKALAKK